METNVKLHGDWLEIIWPTAALRFKSRLASKLLEFHCERRSRELRKIEVPQHIRTLKLGRIWILSENRNREIYGHKNWETWYRR